MRKFSLAFFLFLLGCTSTPNAPAPQKPLVERVGLKTVSEPTPTCQPGHEGALAEGVLVIRPGEVLCVQLEAHGQEVVPLAVVTKPDDMTLVVRFWKEPGSERNSFLSVHNPLGAFLSYQATMRVSGHDEFVHTSTCPVLSKRLAIEHWPYELDALRLGSFRILPDSQTVDCQ